MKSKIIKIVINLITLLNIIIIFFIIYHLIINNKYSRSYIRELLDKNKNCTNYIVETQELIVETNEITTEKVTQYNNISKIEYLGNNVNSIIFNINNLKFFEDKYNNIKQYVYSENSTEILGNRIFIPYINDSNYNYKYIKNENFNNVGCIVVEFKNTKPTTDTEILFTYKLWIDKNNGFVLKEEEYNNDKLYKITNYKVNINCVTDSDIVLPDIDQYEFFEVAN